MVATHEILLKAMDYFGVDLTDLDSNFRTRFLFQKYTYLMQSTLGFHAGNYSLYIRGPYSREVANMGYYIFGNNDQVRKSIKKIDFSPQIKRRIFRINELFSNSHLNRFEALEAWTTYHYIRTNFFPKPTFQKAINELFNMKPKLKAKKNKIISFIKGVDQGLNISYG